METYKILVDSSEKAALRIDALIAKELNLSRSIVQTYIAEEQVKINDLPLRKSTKGKIGDTITVIIPDPVDNSVVAQNIPLNIVFEDKHLLVVNKPKGMVVHPAPGNPDGTLVNALLYHCKNELSGIGGEIRPGIVHRIDKDTSGLLVVAKNDKTHIGLSEQMAVHSIDRTYHAVVYGKLKSNVGFVEAPIGRDSKDRKKMAVTDRNSKYAYTGYTLLEQFNGFAYIACELKTGRTHQIRVHMNSIGHPLAGDPLYGPRNVIKALNGQCLHAKSLGFIHPITGEHMFFDSELPEYFVSFLAKLKKERFE